MILTMMVPAESARRSSEPGSVKAMALTIGFALEGKVSDDGETAELLIDLYTVEGGVTADAPTGGLYIASTLNADTVQLLLYQEGQSYTIAEHQPGFQPGGSDPGAHRQPDGSGELQPVPVAG